MRPGGLTVTAAINVRPRVVIRRITDAKPQVQLNGKPVSEYRDLATDWPLVSAFLHRLGERHGAAIEIHAADHLRLGLGSSGAGATLLAATLGILEGDELSAEDIIRNAHEFETRLAGCPCGPQDHAASVLGSLRILEFGQGCKQRLLPYASRWGLFSFWSTGETRQARSVIPTILRPDGDVIWDLKKAVTARVADAIVSGRIQDVIAALRHELQLQRDLGMLTERQLAAVVIVETLDSAAKVSGAGNGGTLVVLSRCGERKVSIQHALVAAGLRELMLSVEGTGIRIETQG